MWFSASLCALSELCGEELLDSGRRELHLKNGGGCCANPLPVECALRWSSAGRQRAWRSADRPMRRGVRGGMRPGNQHQSREWHPAKAEGISPAHIVELLAQKRASAQAPHRPARRQKGNPHPWLTNKRTRLWRSAPSAAPDADSCVRCDTKYGARRRRRSHRGAARCRRAPRRATRTSGSARARGSALRSSSARPESAAWVRER